MGLREAAKSDERKVVTYVVRRARCDEHSESGIGCL